MMSIIVIVIIVLVAAFISYSIITLNKIKNNGIEVDATVKITITNDISSDGMTEKYYHYYAIYKDDNGYEIEGTIGNVYFRRFREGEHIRIKYLPSNPKYVYFVSKID